MCDFGYSEEYYDKDIPERIKCDYGDGNWAVAWSESRGMYVCEDHLELEDITLA